MKISLQTLGFSLLIIILLQKNSFGQCSTAKYASLPYTQDFESWVTLCDTSDYNRGLLGFNVPDSSWVNTPASGNDSWRRYDQGTNANWSNPPTSNGNLGLYSPVSYSGSYSACFDGFDANNGTTGTLDLYVNCNTTTIGNKELSFYYINEGNGDSLNVYVSADSGMTFSSPLVTCTITPNGWTNYTVPIVSNSPKTIIRFVASEANYEYADIGLDYVQVLLPCQDKPVAGNITVTHQIQFCPSGGSDTLMLSGETVNSEGLSCIWQQSTDNIKWSTIPGDSSIRTAVVAPPVLTYYRVVMTCRNSRLSDTSIKVTIPASGSIGLSYYRKIPYTQDFESWMNGCDSFDLPDTGWTNTPATGDASWRRNDQGYTANWPTFSFFGLYSPQSYLGNYSATFDAFDDGYSNNDAMGTLNLYINCSTFKGNKLLSFYYINSGTDSMNVYVSTDGGLTFGTPIVTCTTTNGWTNYSTLIASDSAETVISFVVTANVQSSFGTDIGLDDVQVIPSCQDKPVAGNIVTKITCSSDSLFLTGNSSSFGISYTWQQSNDGISWSTMVGDSSTSVATPLSQISSYYRTIVTCTTSGLADTTVKVKLAQSIGSSFYRKIPYTEDFETWLNRCDSLDVPDTGWINNPATGNNSWRRDDEGLTANWTYPTAGLYNPTSYSGSFSAAFDALDAANTIDGNSGILDLYVNCSTVTGNKLLSFYYFNPCNGDSINVYISTNGGLTFSSSLITCTTASVWTNYSIQIASVSATTIIRFVAATKPNQYYYSDIGLDYVQVLPACEGKPSVGKASANTAMICDSGRAAISVLINGGGIGLYSYEWQISTDSIKWLNLAGDTTPNITSPYLNSFANYFRCIVTCVNSGQSDTSNKVYIKYLPNCYCPPMSTYETGDNIGNVTISHDSTIILNSGVDSPAIIPNLFNTGQYYINYVDSLPGLVVNLIQGDTFNISTDAVSYILSGNYPDTAYVYIDYNQDGTWESNERVWSAPYILPSSNIPKPVSGTFIVPVTADTGYTEMRIQLSHDSAVITPCYNDGGGNYYNDNTGGETEDYIVHIAPSLKPSGFASMGNSNYSINVYPNPFDNQYTLLLIGLPQGEFILNMTNTLGQKVLELKDQNTKTTPYERTFDLTGLPSGMYYLSILLNGNNYVKQIVKAN